MMKGMITLLTGTDDFRLFRAKRRLVKNFLATYPEGEVVIADAEDEGVRAVIHLTEATAGDLFGGEKYPILLHPDRIPEGGQADFLNWLEHRKREGKPAVVVAPGKFAKSDPYHKKLLKVSSAHENFDPLGGDALCREIQILWGEKATQATLSPAAVGAIAAALPGDLYRIDSELEKLRLYKTEGVIAHNDVAVFLTPQAESVVFSIFDQLYLGRVAEAEALLEQEIRRVKKDDLFRLFGLFVSQLRTLLCVHDCLARGIRTESAVAAELKIHPFAAKKTIRAAARVSLPRAKKALALLSEADIAVKNGDTEIETALILFIWKF